MTYLLTSWRTFWHPRRTFDVLTLWSSFRRQAAFLDVMTFIFWRHSYFWRYDILFDVFFMSWRKFDIMTYFLMSRRALDVILFDIMMYFSHHDIFFTSWRTFLSWRSFWHHDVFLTSRRNFDVMMSFWHHDVYLTYLFTFWRHDSLYAVMTYSCYQYVLSILLML